ncbi:rub [Symbiodinium sp. CCMP2592]|nr:rub [Symbiodinium sp. CCMP2592]
MARPSRNSGAARNLSHVLPRALPAFLLAGAWQLTWHSYTWVQGVVPTSRHIGVGRAAEDDDSGEFDFGEYDAPMGVSVMEAEEEEKAELAPPEAEVFMTRETGRYDCQNCGYEYNPLFGEGNYGPGTKFEDLPSSWRCPQCQVSKDEFQAVIEEVAGFAENQDYGVGFNTWTSGQKGVIIWGLLAGGAALLLSAYSWE